MATVYKFSVSVPATTTLPRDRITNTFHMQHVTGGLDDSALEGMCQDIVALYQARLGNATKEVNCKAYDVDAVPNYPRAEVVVNTGQAWTINFPREICLVLSFAGEHRGNRSERGRLYLQHTLNPTVQAVALRPSSPQLTWALEWYTKPNESFPDLGGVDWKFGIYSKQYQKFTQSQQAWVNDDWDIQRRRGLRESTRLEAQREG